MSKQDIDRTAQAVDKLTTEVRELRLAVSSIDSGVAAHNQELEALRRAVEALAARESVDVHNQAETDETSAQDAQEATHDAEGRPESGGDTPHPNEADGLVGAGDVIEHLYAKLPEDVVEDVEAYNVTHGGETGVQVVPGREVQGTDDYELLKTALGGNQEDSPLGYHLGFDGECYACGEEDGEFWLFLPNTATEVVDA